MRIALQHWPPRPLINLLFSCPLPSEPFRVYISLTLRSAYPLALLQHAWTRHDTLLFFPTVDLPSIHCHLTRRFKSSKFFLTPTLFTHIHEPWPAVKTCSRDLTQQYCHDLALFLCLSVALIGLYLILSHPCPLFLCLWIESAVQVSSDHVISH